MVMIRVRIRLRALIRVRVRTMVRDVGNIVRSLKADCNIVRDLKTSLNAKHCLFSTIGVTKFEMLYKQIKK